LLSRLNLLREATLIQSSLLVITQALFHVPGRGTSGEERTKGTSNILTLPCGRVYAQTTM
jgi:hypothetical protein